MAAIHLCRKLLENDVEKERKRAAKAAGLSFVLDRAGIQKILKVTSNTTLEGKVSRLSNENAELKVKAREDAGTIRRLKAELRKAQDEKGDGEMDRRALLTMAQELQDQGLYVKQLEAQLRVPSDS